MTEEIGRLLDEALAHHRAGAGEEDSKDYDEFLADAARLRDHGLAAVDACFEWFASGDPTERATAADLFGRLCYETTAEVHERCFGSLVAMLDREVRAFGGEPLVLSAIGYSFGHCEDSRGVPYLLALSVHPSEDVRLSVARALPSVVRFQPVPDAVAELVQLSADRDEDVRDWSCFGLGQLGADGAEVREALRARLDDEHVDTRCEALIALARLGDPSALEVLERRLLDDDLYLLEVDAAAALGDTALHPLLVALAERWGEITDEEAFELALERALRRCAPDTHAAAKALETSLVEEMTRRLETGQRLEVTGTFPHSRLSVTGPDGTVLAAAPLWPDELEPTDVEGPEDYRDTWLHEMEQAAQ